MHETQVQSLDREDPLAEGNGNPLQSPCLGSPMEREELEGYSHRVAKSKTGVSD